MGTIKTRAPSERRRNVRKPKKFTIKFRCVGGQGKPDTAGRVGQIVNVSRGGVLLHSKRPMPSGAVIELRFPPNVFSGGAVMLHGVVRRLGPESDTGDHPMGLMFVRISDKRSTQPVAKQPRKERRRTPRDVQRLVVKIRCGSFGAPAGENDPEGVITNLSPRGMELSATHPYPPGAALEVQIPRSVLGPGRKVSGRVVWMMEGDSLSEYRLGVDLGNA